MIDGHKLFISLSGGRVPWRLCAVGADRICTFQAESWPVLSDEDVADKKRWTHRSMNR